jgi:hypothetical protein
MQVPCNDTLTIRQFEAIQRAAAAALSFFCEFSVVRSEFLADCGRQFVSAAAHLPPPTCRFVRRRDAVERPASS